MLKGAISMHGLKTFFVGMLGTGLGLFFMVAMVLSLPLNVLVAMRWFGFQWWSALLAVFVFSCIPGFGQLGYLIATVVGAFYLYNAGFDWDRAVRPLNETASAQTFRISDLSDADFRKYKLETMRPNLVKECIKTAKEQSGFKGKIPEGMTEYCSCSAVVVLDNLSKEDLSDWQRSVEPNADRAQQVRAAVAEQCKITSR
jgi:hypothetical protein